MYGLCSSHATYRMLGRSTSIWSMRMWGLGLRCVEAALNQVPHRRSGVVVGVTWLLSRSDVVVGVTWLLSRSDV
jgi:hypothetical protein